MTQLSWALNAAAFDRQRRASLRPPSRTAGSRTRRLAFKRTTTAMQAQLESRQRKAAHLAGEVQARDTRIAELTRSLSDARVQLASGSADAPAVARLQADLADVRASLAEVKGEERGATAERATLRREAARLQEEAERLAAQLKQSQVRACCADSLPGLLKRICTQREGLL
jgi:chromosome segregation ATPase